MRLLLVMLVLGAALMLGMPRFANAMGTTVYPVEVTVFLRDAAGRAMPNVRVQDWRDDQPGQYVVTDGAGRAVLRYGFAKGWLDRAGKTELPVHLRFLPALPGASSPFLSHRYRFELRSGKTTCDYSVFEGNREDWSRDPLSDVDVFDCMAGVTLVENRVIQLTLALTHQGTVKAGTR